MQITVKGRKHTTEIDDTVYYWHDHVKKCILNQKHTASRIEPYRNKKIYSTFRQCTACALYRTPRQN